MQKRKIKNLTIEYDDGDVMILTEENMQHISRQMYHKGARKQKEGYTSHEIIWTTPEPLYSGDE